MYKDDAHVLLFSFLVIVESKPTNIVGVASPKLLFFFFSRVWVFPDTANEKKRKSLADTLRNGRHGRGHAEKYKTSSETRNATSTYSK